jgi:two-component system chemotaxis response regulator CheB
MVSSLTQKGAATTFECLELGAFDFVAKPDGTVSSNLILLGNEIRSKLKAAAVSGTLKRLVSRREKRPQLRAAQAAPKSKACTVAAGYKAVALGISTGGPVTLMDVLPLIPADVNAVFFLVQHMPGSFIHTFAQRLNDACQIEVIEAEAGVSVRPGVCYVAPGEHQLTLFRKSSGDVVMRTPTQPETLFMPSVDVMMKSVLQTYGADTVGVLMTGIGNDGAEQMVAITQAGGHTIAESEESAVVFGMPRQAIENGGARVVAPSWGIAAEILKAL